MNITAKVVPFSSVVGSSVTLHDETGKVVCQLALLNTGTSGDAQEWKRRQTSFAEEIAARLNAPQPSDLPGRGAGELDVEGLEREFWHDLGYPSDERWTRQGIASALKHLIGEVAALVSQPHPEGEAVALPDDEVAEEKCEYCGNYAHEAVRCRQSAGHSYVRTGRKLYIYHTQPLYLHPAPHKAGADGLVDEVMFLLARLDDLERGWDDEEAYSQYAGHVAPSVARLRALLAALTSMDRRA